MPELHLRRIVASPVTVPVDPKAATSLGDLGRYRLVAELARGGMGVVYLAIVRGPGGFNKLLVVKELKGHLAEDSGHLDMFLAEAKLAARLDHENIVQTIEVGSEDNRHFMVMEYLEGQTLQAFVTRSRKQKTKIPIELHLQILCQVLTALEYAHSLEDFDGKPIGVVHRDVSPQNVFLTYAGRVKLVDFGIAKTLESGNETRTGVLKGKIAYLAPEQARGLRVDRRTDVFAVGVMLFQAVTGTKLWAGLNDLQILHRLVDGDIPKPSEVESFVPEDLEAIIKKAMAEEPADRYPTAAAMLVDLEAALASRKAGHLSQKEFGAKLEELFQEDKAKLRRLVQEQLSHLRGFATGEWRASEIIRLDRTGSGPGSLTPSAEHALPTITGDGTPITGSGASNISNIGSTVTPTLEPPRPQNRQPIILGALLAATVLGVTALLVMRRGPEAVPTTTTSASAPSPKVAETATSHAASVTAVAAPTQVLLTIKFTPKSATVFVDGAKATGTPAVAQLTPGKHLVRVEAPGYVSFEESRALSSDFTLEVDLDKTAAATVTATQPKAAAKPTATEPTATATATAPPPPPPTATTPPAVSTSEPTTKKPKHEIDKSNPY